MTPCTPASHADDHGDELRKQELARLDELLAAVWPAAMRRNPDAVKSATELIDRRCKLLGLDAPARHEATQGAPYECIDVEIARLEAEHAQKMTVAKPPTVHTTRAGERLGADVFFHKPGNYAFLGKPGNYAPSFHSYAGSRKETSWPNRDYVHYQVSHTDVETALQQVAADVRAEAEAADRDPGAEFVLDHLKTVFGVDLTPDGDEDADGEEPVPDASEDADGEDADGEEAPDTFNLDISRLYYHRLYQDPADTAARPSAQPYYLTPSTAEEAAERVLQVVTEANGLDGAELLDRLCRAFGLLRADGKPYAWLHRGELHRSAPEAGR